MAKKNQEIPKENPAPSAREEMARTTSPEQADPMIRRDRAIMQFAALGSIRGWDRIWKEGQDAGQHNREPWTGSAPISHGDSIRLMPDGKAFLIKAIPGMPGILQYPAGGPTEGGFSVQVSTEDLRRLTEKADPEREAA
jgi:hypothetical protein